MKVDLVSIGNSKGIRIPRSVIEQCGFGDRLDMRVAEGKLVLTPARNPREGWDAAFERMAAAGDDTLLMPDDLEHSWDDEEWTW